MTRRLSTADLLYLSLHWFSLHFHWGALLTVVIPAEVLKFVAAVDKGRTLGMVFAGGAFTALVVMPLAGALSDRSTSPFGRRRPFIAAGAVLNAAGLLAMGAAPTLGLFMLAYWFVQFANNFGGSAYSGFIPDRVPPEQRGTASGMMGLMSMLGTIGGSLTAGRLLQHGQAMTLYAAIGALLLVSMLLTVWKVPDPPQQSCPPFRWRTFRQQFWIDPRKFPDFAWLFLSRFVAMMGVYTLLTFLQFFLKDYLQIPNFIEATATVVAVVPLAAVPSSLAAGWLSDRIGRRGIVSGATLLMGVLSLIFLLAPSFQAMLILGAILGIGYGALLSVEWALATEVLPSPSAAAKDLGIWGMAVTLPQVVAPLVGGPILDVFNRGQTNQGYIVLLGIGAVYFFISSLTVWKIRGAR